MTGAGIRITKYVGIFMGGNRNSIRKFDRVEMGIETQELDGI